MKDICKLLKPIQFVCMLVDANRNITVEQRFSTQINIFSLDSKRGPILILLAYSSKSYKLPLLHYTCPRLTYVSFTLLSIRCCSEVWHQSPGMLYDISLLFEWPFYYWLYFDKMQ